MSVAAKRVFFRAAADFDIDAAFDHYQSVDGHFVAQGFADALAAATRHIALHPATGSPRHAQLLDIPGLRSWPLTRYPYLVFYFDLPDGIDVVRVLHGAMDLPEWLM